MICSSMFPVFLWVPFICCCMYVAAASIEFRVDYSAHAENAQSTPDYLKNERSGIDFDHYLFPKEQFGGAKCFDDKCTVVEILRRIHAIQHPPRSLCASRRLLVLQFPSDSFEGIGSILKLLMVGLAEAVYSNRTLIWGLDIPNLFEFAREKWWSNVTTLTHITYPHEDATVVEERNTLLGRRDALNTALECNWYAGGGPFSCFFEKISSCSLLDVSWDELSSIDFDDSARVKIMEVRRNAVAYHPPPSTLFQRNMTFPRHKWASSLAAYVFRLKPAAVNLFEKSRIALGISMSRTLALHVRHGDVKAMPYAYGNRRAYSVEAYLKAARQMLAHVPADALYVATDNPKLQLPEVLHAEQSSVSVLTASNNIRYRTEHGSHTVAADGACLPDRTCSLEYHDILHYKALAKSTRPNRVSRVLYESLEDLYLLSLCNGIVGTLTSHFTTFAALLIGARTGFITLNNIAYLDWKDVRSGQLQHGMLHGSLNRTRALQRGRFHERWLSMQNRFHEKLPLDQEVVDGNTFHDEEGLPFMPEHIRNREIPRWLGDASILPLWPGECPFVSAATDPVLQQISTLVNAGVDHMQIFRYHQALKCWKAAESVIDESAGSLTPQQVADYSDVVRENIAAVVAKQHFPYSSPSERIAYLISLNLTPRLQEHDTLQIPSVRP